MAHRSLVGAGARSQAAGALRPLLIAAALTAAVIASGCAYYNTFYTARKHYRDAEAQRLASGEERAAPASLELYQRSIERSQKVLTNYPKSKWVDDARLLIGMAYLRREEWEKARSAFEELMARQPDSELVPDARLGIGLCQIGRGEWQEADKTLTALYADEPRFDRRDEVLLQLARSAAKRREYRLAIQHLTHLLDADPDEEVEAEAHKARGEAYLEVDAPDSALVDYKQLVQLTSRPEQRFDADLQVGECLERLGRAEEALEYYARLEREMPGPAHMPRTLLAEARALGDLGRHAEALVIYERVTREFPASNYAAQALYQIGLTQELHLNDVEKAKEAYAKVRETAAGSEFADLADERRNSLDLFGQYREEIATSSEEEKKAQAGLLLAELSLFRLRKVDEALAQYQAVETDYPQSSIAPKAAFAVAWIHENERGDSATAATVYRRVFDYYPNTEYGVHAGVKAGVLSADSLSIYLGQIYRQRATADSLAAVARIQATADSLGVDVAAAADSLAVAKGDSLAAAARDSIAAADSLAIARLDSLAAAAVPRGRAKMDSLPGGREASAVGAGDSALSAGDSLLPFDPYSNIPPEERPRPDSLLNPPRESDP
jgi:TolA-binding protein